MITPFQMNLLTDPVADIYLALEMEILKQITRRLKIRGEADINEYQLRKLSQLHLLNRDIERYLAMASGIATEEIRNTIQQSGYELIEDTDEYLKRDGIKLLPKPSIEPLMESYVNQTFREINNFVNQTLITTNFGEGVVTDMYRKIIEETTAKVSTGLMTMEEAIEDTIKQWAVKGVPSTFIDKGGHTWSLERYTRTVLRSTNARTYNELRTARMNEHGVYTVLISAKPKARPICAQCQGKVLDTRLPMESDSGYPSVYEYGYGTPEGHRGKLINAS